jgi:acyl dehydratase
MDNAAQPHPGPYFEDIGLGDEIGPVVWDCTPMDLLRYASGSRDFNLIHHDSDYAREAGLPGTIIQGSLKSAVLSDMLIAWLGEHGSLAKLAIQYRGVDVPGIRLTGGGLVTDRYSDREGNWIIGEVWLEDPSGARNTRGSVVSSWVSRSNSASDALVVRDSERTQVR